jgi:drug/metabolite transporter (DMT)-like permease
VPRLALLAFIWGWSFLFIKVGVEGMTPTTVAGLRIALGAAVLLGVCRLRGLPVPTDRTSLRHFLVVALFGSALPFTMLAWGEERIASNLTAVLNASTPLFAALAGAALLGERLRRTAVVGLLVGLAGVAVAAGVGGSDLGASSVAGGLAAVLAGACYGYSFTYMKSHLLHLPALVAAAGQLLVGTAVLAPAVVVTTVRDGIDPAPHRLLAIVLLGVVGTGLAYVLNYQVVAELGPTTASLVTYLVPVVAVAVGVTFLDEVFHLRVLAGGVLIVVGIALVHGRLPSAGRPFAARRRSVRCPAWTDPPGVSTTGTGTRRASGGTPPPRRSRP